MRTTILAALGVILLAFPALAQDRQAAPQRGGCASGFCAMSNAPAQDAAAETDIDAVESDMKRQLSGQPKPQPQMGMGGMGGQMGGMMGMCPCMRMMAMMMKGRGMPMPDMPNMDMKSMPGMTPPGMTPIPDKAPSAE